jgi:nucleoid DNA-binding protein
MAKRKAKKKTTRSTAKKTTRRTTKKKTTRAAAKRPARVSSANKPRTKSEIYNAISDQTGLARKEVSSVFDALGSLLAADLSKRGPGVMQVPGLMKVTVKRMPATRARKGINPFTKEPTIFKAKPARKVLKARFVKAAKDALG